MRNRRFVSVLAGLLIMVFFLAGAPAGAAVITIGTAYPGGITQAITDAGDGGTVILEPGTYIQHDITIGNSVTIRSQSGSAADTIIDAQVLGRIFDNTGGYALTIDNLTLQNGYIIGNGGAIYADDGALTITSSAFSNCSVNNTAGASHGGAIYADGGTLTITASTFSGCSADSTVEAAPGGAVYAAGSTVSVDSSDFTSCSAGGGGGGAILADGGTLTITTSTFTNCRASSIVGSASGGAILVTNNGVVTIESSTFTGCSADSVGGAITHYDSTVTITSSEFSDCSAGSGGAVGSAAMTSAKTLTITHSRFTRCSATGSISSYGGAIYTGTTGPSMTNTISDTAFTDCTADDNGGAIYNSYGTLSITGSTFTGCSAEQGGAIWTIGEYSINAATVTITGTMFTDCTAPSILQSGGAIAIRGTSSVTIRSSSFIRCMAGYYGGAIYSDGSSSSLDIADSLFSYCTSSVNAGAISTNSGSTIITGTVFDHCSAENSGGAIDVIDDVGVSITSSTFSACSATFGGAINTWNTGTVTVSTSTFSDCSALGSGGAIDVYQGPVTVHFSRFANCSNPQTITSYDGPVDARYDWWGSNDDPSSQTSTNYGSVTTAPWLVLGITADPASIGTAGTSAIRTNLTFDSDGTDTSGGGIFLPDGITNTWAMVSGSGSVSPLTGGTVNGAAQTTFTPVDGGTVNISGTVDDQTVYTGVTVTWPAPAVTAITPNAGLNVTGIAITDLAGSGFLDGAGVRLVRAGHTNITATGVTVVSPSQITCTFPITHAEAGAWDVVVVNPDGQETVLPGGFTVTAPGSLDTVTSSSTEDTSGTLSDFPSSPANPLMTVTVNIGGDSKAWQAIVTGTNLRDLIVTGMVQNGAGGNCAEPPGSTFQYLGLEPARYGTITNAVINFSVPQSWLDENHIDPGSIVLYHMTPDCWQALPTTFQYAKDGAVYYSAQSAGFSSFAIAGTPAAAEQVITGTPPLLMNEVVQTPAPAAVVKAPVTTQTTAPPAPADAAPAKSSPLPLVPVIAVICCIGLIGGGWYARRWWIRRQNPALFEEF